MAGKEEITLKIEHHVGDEFRHSYTYRSGPVVFGGSKLSLVPVDGVAADLEVARVTFRDDGSLHIEALSAEPQLSLNKRYVSTGTLHDRDEVSLGVNRYRVRVIKGFAADHSKDEGRGHTLEIAMFWGDSVLRVENYLKPLEIRVGETEKSAFFIPEEILGKNEYPLIRGFGDSFYLNLAHKDLDGRILIGNDIFTLDEVRSQNLLKENAYLKITPETRCRLFFKHLSLLISYTPLPAPLEKKYLQQFSLDSFLYFSVSLVLHLAFLIAINLIPEEDLRARRFTVNKRNPMIEVIVQAKKAEEKKEEEEKKDEKLLDEDAVKEQMEKEGKKLALDEVEKKVEKDELTNKLAPEELKEHNREIALNTGAAKVLRQQTDLITNLMNSGVGDWGGMDSGIKVIGSSGVGPDGFMGGGNLDPFGGAVGMGTGGGFRGTAISLKAAYGGGEYLGELGKGTAGANTQIKIKGTGARKIKTYGAGADVSGQLDKKIIQKIIRRHMPEVKWCYQQGLQKNQRLEGKIVVSFTISPIGKVITTKVKATTMRNKEVEACVMKKVRRWKFPEPRGGGIVKVNYPFIFKTTE
jgi:TonB family protein